MKVENIALTGQEGGVTDAKIQFCQLFQSNSTTFFIAAPPRSIVIQPHISTEDDKYLNVSCAVSGVYPHPVVDISWTNK